MQMVSEVMSRNVRFVSPNESLQRAAQMMDELNVGALPVCDGDRLVGMVTDRDITIRGVAAGRAPEGAHVDEVMSTDVRWVFEDQTLDDVMIQMADSQIRRVPVVTHDEQHKLVGIVSLGDMATKSSGEGQKKEMEEVVEMVSTTGSRSAGADEVGGRSGKGGAGAAATGTESAVMAGTDLPREGETGGGLGHGVAAGATGDPRHRAEVSGERGGATGDTRGNYGVGGKDLTGSGDLPPA
ncbi:MAG TPA: CBS domain-containing protein [Noviherbaspirillum sp.]